MQTLTKPRVLCVDDEPGVLEGLTLNLRRRYEVLTAPGGEEGLRALEATEDVAVVLSDMRMPGMNGAEFLGRVREAAPGTVRMLLTGQADLESAIAAVNDGQVFRFLTKPCPTATLLAAFEAAAEQHRLVTAERVLLEQTLRGSVDALADLLALNSPIAFGRATRVKKAVSELAAKLGIEPVWQVEVAAMLSQLGAVTLPASTLERLHYGQPLDESEQRLVDELPAVTDRLLAHIPRLETVRAVLAAYAKPVRRADGAGSKSLVQRCAAVLKVAVDLDALEAMGLSSAQAIAALREKRDHDPEVLEALRALRTEDSSEDRVREVFLAHVQVGMVFAEDVKTESGALLVARGYEVTHGFIDRLRNFPPSTARQPVHVAVPR